MVVLYVMVTALLASAAVYFTVAGVVYPFTAGAVKVTSSPNGTFTLPPLLRVVFTVVPFTVTLFEVTSVWLDWLVFTVSVSTAVLYTPSNCMEVPVAVKVFVAGVL
jgi:hypothetical protein